MRLFDGLSKKEKQEKTTQLEKLLKESVYMIPKTKYQLRDYLREHGWNVDDSTAERYAMRFLDYTNYREIGAKYGTYIIKPYGTHGSTKLFLPKDPYLKERAVRNLGR